MKTKKKERVITRLRINPFLKCPECKKDIDVKCCKNVTNYWMDEMLSNSVELGLIIKDIDANGGVVLMASERYLSQLENHIRLIKSINSPLNIEYSTVQSVSRRTGKTINVRRVEITKKNG